MATENDLAEDFRRLASETLTKRATPAELPSGPPQFAAPKNKMLESLGIKYLDPKVYGVDKALSRDKSFWERDQPFGLYGDMPVRPDPTTVSWMNEAYQDRAYDNLPWHQKLLVNVGKAATTGPTGFAFKLIQYPLTVAATGARLFLENQHKFSPFVNEAQGNPENRMGVRDALGKLNIFSGSGTYTFGEVLHDMDYLQDTNWAWKVGLAGDIFLDPLTYLTFGIGKAGLLAARVASKGGVKIARHTARRAVDDAAKVAFEAAGRSADEIARISDRIAALPDSTISQLADSIVSGSTYSRGFNTVTGEIDDVVKHVDDAVEVNLRSLFDEIGEGAVDDVFLTLNADDVADMRILFDPQIRGTTGVSDDVLRVAATQIHKNRLDETLRVVTKQADDAVGVVAKETKKKGFYGARKREPKEWFPDLGEAQNVHLAFGFKVPLSGSLGQKIFKHNLQQPIGFKVLGSATNPVIGTWLRAIPQATRSLFFGRKIVKNGPLARIFAATTGKAAPEGVLGTAEGGLIGWMRRGGRRQDVRQLARQAFRDGDAVAVHQYKSLLHISGRGDAAARKAGTDLSRLLKEFRRNALISDVDSQDLVAALRGNEEAIAILKEVTGNREIGGKIETVTAYDLAQEFMENLRVVSNRMAHRDFLGKVDNYLPRVLSDDAARYLESKNSGLIGRRHKNVKRKYGPSGFEEKRTYVSAEEYDELVKQKGEEAVLESGMQKTFLGEELYDPANANGLSVEEQIAEIMHSKGINYSLFDDDFDRVMDVYIGAISKRIGEVYSESLLIKEGIFVDVTTSFVHIPNGEVAGAVHAVRKAQTKVAQSANALDEALEEAILQGNEEVAKQTAHVKKLEEIAEQAQTEYDSAVAKFNKLAEDALQLEELNETRRVAVDEINRKFAAISEGAAFSEKVVAVAEEAKRLLDEKERLFTSGLLDFHTGALKTASVQKIVLENRIFSLFGSKKTWDEFVALAKNYDPISEPDFAAYIKQAAPDMADDDVAKNVEWMNQVSELVSDIDSTPQGPWLALQNETVESLQGQPSLSNFVNNIESTLKMLDNQIEISKGIVSDGQKLLADAGVAMEDLFVGGKLPTPENISEAKQIIVQKLDEAMAPETVGHWWEIPIGHPEYGKPMAASKQYLDLDRAWAKLMSEDPDFKNSVHLFYDSFKGFNVKAAFVDGQDLNNLIESGIRGLDDKRMLAKELGSLEIFNDPLIASNGKGRVFNDVTVQDLATWIKWRDQTLTSFNSGSLPAPVTHNSAEDILQGGVIRGVSQHSDTGYVLEDLGVDLEDAEDILEILDGSNLVVKVDFGDKTYFLKRYLGDQGLQTSIDLPNASAAEHRVTGEVLADNLYDQLSSGGAPRSSYSFIDNGTELDGWWKVSEEAEQIIPADAYDVSTQYRRTLLNSQGGILGYEIVRIANPQDVIAATDVPLRELRQQSFMADVLLGNHDVMGYGGPDGVNFGINRLTGEFVRLDNGASFFYRGRGVPKSSDPSFNFGEVQEMFGPETFFDESYENAIGHVNDNLLMRQGLGSAAGFVSEMSNQLDVLLDIRLNSGGWENWVRNLMPDLSDDNVALYTAWLDDRSRTLAGKFNKKFDDDIPVPSVLNLIHRSELEGFLPQGQIIGTADAGWLDSQTGLNANVGNVENALFGGGESEYLIQLGLPRDAGGARYYGFPLVEEDDLVELLIEQSKLNPTTEVGEFFELERQIQALEKTIENDAMTIGVHGSIFDGGVRDQAWDIAERVFNSDPDLLRNYLEQASSTIPSGAGSNTNAYADFVLELMDSVDRLSSRSLFGIDPDGVPLGWRDKMLIVSEILIHDDIGFGALVGKVDPALKGILDNWFSRVPSGLSEPKKVYENLPEVIGILESLPDVRLRELISERIKGLSSDAGIGARRSSYIKRLQWEQSPLLAAFHDGRIFKEGTVSSLNRSNRNIKSTLNRELFGNNTAEMDRVDRLTDEILKEEGGSFDTVSGGDYLTGQSPVGVTGITPAIRATGDVSGIIKRFFADEGLPVPDIDSATLRLIEEELMLNKLPSRVYSTYRNSLTLDGYNVAVWRNRREAVSVTGHGSEIAGQSLFMLTNPYAIRPVQSVDSQMKMMAGQIDGQGKLLDYEKAIDEYIKAIDAEFAGMTARQRADWGKKFEKFINPDDVLVQMQNSSQQRIEGLGSVGLESEALKDLAEARARVESAGLPAKELKEARIVLEGVQSRVDEMSRAQRTLNTILDENNIYLEAPLLRGAYEQLQTSVAILHSVNLEQNRKALELALGQGDLNDIARYIGDINQGSVDGISNELLQAIEGLKTLEGAKPIPKGGLAADPISPDDDFWFPLKSFQDREKILDEVFVSGFKAFGVNAQGPEAMVDAMTAVTRFQAQGGWGAFLRQYDKVHNLLKGYMIAKPGFHMRNLFSSTFMNFLHGVDIASYRQFQRAYWQVQHELAVERGAVKTARNIRVAMRSRGIWRKTNDDAKAIVREMLDENIVGTSAGQIGVEFTGSSARGGRIRRAWSTVNPFNSRNLPLQLSRNVGMGVETYVRGALGFDVIKKGGTVDEAFDAITTWHFDYDDLSDFERGVVKRVIPFYTWTKNAMPLMIEQIGKNPAKMSLYFKLKNNVEQGQDRAPIVPEYFHRQQAMQLPVKYKGENMFWLPDLPFKAPFELLDPALSFDTDMSAADRVKTALGSVLTQTTPLIKAPVEWYMQRNIWKGYSFSGRYQEVPTAYQTIPLLMPMLDKLGLSENQDDKWFMKDYDLHAMGQLLPTFTDLRRLFPSEERYQQRTLSSWLSFVFGAGIRTNTRDEQQRVLQSLRYERQEEIDDMNSLRRAAAKANQ